MLAATGHKPHHYPLTLHTALAWKGWEGTCNCIFFSSCADTQCKIQGILRFPNPSPSFHFLFLLFPLASLLTSAPSDFHFSFTLLACRNVWHAEMKLIGSLCRSVQPPVAHCCVRYDWHTFARTCCKTKSCFAASFYQSVASLSSHCHA